MAGGYELQKEGYEYVENASGSSGTKVYLKIVGGADDLPELGDEFSPEHPEAIATEITEEIGFVDPTDVCFNGYKYTVDYDSGGAGEGEDGTWVKKVDEEQRNFTAGGEIITVNNKPNEAGVWHWTLEPTEDAINESKGKCVQKIYKTNVLGTFSRTVKVAQDDFVSYLNTQLFPLLGHINDPVFESVTYGIFQKGTCLFNSASGNLTIDADSQRFWEIALNFSYKFIPELGLANVVEDTWQYIWRSDTSGDFSEGAFQVPIKKTSPSPQFQGMMYPYGDLNDLYDNIVNP